MNKTLKRISSLVLISIVVIVIQKCGDDSANPTSTYVAGTVFYTNGNFADTNAFYYSVGAYWADSVNSGVHHWQSIPNAVCNMTINQGAKTGYFKLVDLPAGNYYIAAIEIKKSGNCVMGIQGVDTSGITSPPKPVTIVFPDYAGNGAEHFSAVPDNYISGLQFGCP